MLTVDGLGIVVVVVAGGGGGWNCRWGWWWLALSAVGCGRGEGVLTVDGLGVVVVIVVAGGGRGWNCQWWAVDYMVRGAYLCLRCCGRRRRCSVIAGGLRGTSRT